MTIKFETVLFYRYNVWTSQKIRAMNNTHEFVSVQIKLLSMDTSTTSDWVLIFIHNKNVCGLSQGEEDVDIDLMQGS